MKSVVFALFLAMLFGANAGQAMAQEDAADPLSKMIWEMFQMRQGKTLCVVEATPLSTVRNQVANQLRTMGVSHDATPQAVSKALWTLYPCPFSPFRAELRPATAQDIAGWWIFPESSQKLRLGMPMTQPSAPVKCDALGYFPGGEMRHTVARGEAPCPFVTANDFIESIKRPRVSSWSLLQEGRIRISRSDIADHVEEWDVFAVFSPFEVDGVKFQVGDLVTYGRRGKGNDLNAATQFRHLQRLP